MEDNKTVIFNEIVEKTRQASAMLSKISSLQNEENAQKDVTLLLRKVVNLKLMISEETESNIRKLIIMSIKRQNLQKSRLPDDVVMKEIKKYDCHQTSLVSQKKVLLFLYIEKELGITLGDDEAVEIETLEQLTQVLIRHMKRRIK